MQMTQVGVMQGTPTAVGSYQFTVTVMDSTGTTAPLSEGLTVSQEAPLQFTTPVNLPAGTVNSAYSITLQVSGAINTLSFQLAAGSTLPLGLSLNQATGVISGTPVVGGAFSLTVIATEAGTGRSTSQTFNLYISLGVLKANGAQSVSTGGCPCGDPISVGTGNLYEEVTDYSTTGPNQLGFTRYFNSAGGNTLAVSLGGAWRSTYDRYLRLVSSSNVTAERANGQQALFSLSGGAWTSDSDVDLKLTQAGSVWTLTDGSDTVETYNAGSSTVEALLTSVQARNGYTQTLQYNSSNQLVSVTDSFHRTLTFTYSGNLLQTVTTPDGLVLTYAFDSSGVFAGLGRLSSVTYSTTPQTSQSYLYEDPAVLFALTGIVDEDGNQFATWTYDQSGAALTSQHGGGAGLTTFTYNATDGSRTVTNALGQQGLYKFATLQGVPKLVEIDRVATATTAAATETFTYDSNGYLASQTDWNGNLTTYVNDVHGQPTTITEASGTAQSRTTTITYLANFHLPAQIVTPGLTTNFTYDANGELLTKTAVDTTATTVPYSTNGVSRTWTYTWSNFLMASAQGPRTDVAELTKFTYDGSGALTGTANALNQSTQITLHLPGGLPETIVDPNGVTTQLTYDARQRLLTSAVTTTQGVLTTKIAYDAAGNPLTVTLPDGSALTSAYDAAHRLIKTSDLFSQSMAYTLDALGDRTQTNVANAAGTVQRQHSGVFDALGRAVNDTGGVVGETTTYTYDSNGNALTAADPLQHTTQQAFDALNRRIKVTDAAGSSATTAYDAHDRVVSVTDPNGNTTTYVYDGFGDMIQQVSPVTGTTVYHYDLAGNLTQKTDANGAVTNYTYDALDRVLTTTFPADAAENVAYTYDQTGHGFGIGRLTTVTDAAGVLGRSYDERGNITIEIRIHAATTLVTSYAYDAASRIASITYPSGWTIAYTRDGMGRSTAVNAVSPGSFGQGRFSYKVVSSIGYQSFGPVASLTYANGIGEQRSFDLDYRLTSLSATGTFTPGQTYCGIVPGDCTTEPGTYYVPQALEYGYDLDSNVLSIADFVTSGNSQTLAYDVLNRLTSAKGAYGSFTYTYDKNGNRLTGIPGGAAAATTAAELDGMSPVTTLTYNQSNRLATVNTAAQQLAQYTYDAFGQRLVKVEPAISTTTLYQYGQNGLLLEESNNQGNPASADYIYLDDGRPIAIVGPGQFYYMHADRLGTPQLLTSSTQATVWSATYEPFGQTSPVSTGATVESLRLPGQYFDAESGLNHNGFRDYVPNWGRYIQSDPIGLAGGLNTYAYGNGNPVSVVDPSGLLGVGGIFTASGELGAVGQGSGFGVAGSVAAGAGTFWGGKQGVNTGAFVSAGGFANGNAAPGCSTDRNNSAVGAYVGVGAGGWISNAENVGDLEGPFTTVSVNLWFASVQYGWGRNGQNKPIGIFSFTAGPGGAASISQYQTNTWVSNPK
jgi:RHS repeat-associated protein